MGEGIKTRRGNGKGNVYLYNQGNEYAALTGGWIVGYIASGEAIKNTNNLQVKSSAYGQYATWRPSNPIDLAPYSKLKFEVTASITGSCSVNLIVHTNPSGNHSGYVALHGIATTIGSKAIIEIDISSVNGSYYVLFQSNSAGGTSIGNAFKVWLE